MYNYVVSYTNMNMLPKTFKNVDMFPQTMNALKRLTSSLNSDINN